MRVRPFRDRSPYRSHDDGSGGGACRAHMVRYRPHIHMTEPLQPAPTTSSSRSAQSNPIVLSPGEFFRLTLGVWLGGILILTLMPLLLIPRVGMALGVAGSYLLFFIAWQPVQVITQRTLGMRAGIVRMVVFVAAAAAIAFHLRGSLVAACAGPASTIAAW